MLNEIGISVTTFGTLLTLWEYFKPYSGHKFNHERDPMIHGIDPAVDGALPVETKEFASWKSKKRILIIIGFAIIAIGGVMQIFSDQIVYAWFTITG